MSVVGALELELLRDFVPSRVTDRVFGRRAVSCVDRLIVHDQAKLLRRFAGTAGARGYAVEP